jgi:hypothetical protein
MGPKSNLDKVGGVFCAFKINMHQLNTLFYHSSSSIRFFNRLHQVLILLVSSKTDSGTESVTLNTVQW